MNRTTKRLLHLSGVAAASAAVAALTAYGTTKFFVNVAMDRTAPKTVNRAKKLVSGNRSSSGSGSGFRNARQEASDRLAAKEHETVNITSHDGTSLTGHWFPQENAKRIIIAMHGWRTSWSRDFGFMADFWAESGCSVLYAEQRGQGGSGGDYMGFGLIERYDCLDWIHWVNERCGDQIPIYLAGVSMGATTVLMAAGLNLPANVHGIIADCGFTSLDAIWRHVTNANLHLPYNLTGAIANALCKKKIQFGTEDYSTLDALQITTVPVLLIHGTDDRFVPIDMCFENYKACVSYKKLLVVPGAGHAMSCYIDKPGYEAASKDFWQQCDRPAAEPCGHGPNAL